MYSSESSSNRSAARASAPNARTTRSPARFSCTCAESSAMRSCTRSNRRWMRSPNHHTESETSGSGSSERSVSRRLITSMKLTDRIPTVSVFTVYITPGPSIMRTAAMSFVAMDMSSPVRRAWNQPSGRRWRWANSSLRRSNSSFREMPITQWRMAKRKSPASTAMPTTRSA